MAEPTCSIDGCVKRVRGRGWCEMHYRRWCRHGDPEKVAGLGRIEQRTCKTDGCDAPVFQRGFCQEHNPWRRQRAAAGSGHINRQGYRLIYLRDHPLARAGGQVLEHRVVLYDTIGPGWHKCQWCGTTLSWHVKDPSDSRFLTGDHLDFDKLNNDPANLVPSCVGCNGARSADQRTWQAKRIRRRQALAALDL